MSSTPLEEVQTEIDRLVHVAVSAMTGEPAASDASARHAFQRIVVAIDGSPASRHALAWANAIARIDNASVTIVSVVTPPLALESHYAGLAGAWDLTRQLDADRRAVAQLLAGAVETVRGSGSRVAPRTTLAEGGAAEEIVRVANDANADLVIVGSHSRGVMGRIALGSVADAVKNKTKASVLIARSAPPSSHIVVPVDGSPQSRAAAIVAARFAQAWRTDATLVHVTPTTAKPPGDATLRDLVPDADVPQGAPELRYALTVGKPADRILALARSRPAGLVIMGCRGLSGVKSLLAGSVSNRVAHAAPCSVLVMKEGAA